jgi:hypothetical protein
MMNKPVGDSNQKLLTRSALIFLNPLACGQRYHLENTDQGLKKLKEAKVSEKSPFICDNS